jgi:hypothetical protein
MTFDEAQDAFRASPNLKTAAVYLDTAMTYASDDMIGDDTFLNAVAEVAGFMHGEAEDA